MEPIGGTVDGSGFDVPFDAPGGVAADADGTLYVVDFGNDRIQGFAPKS
jgi:DNA-binding beta-propeller fold protein YncE